MFNKLTLAAILVVFMFPLDAQKVDKADEIYDDLGYKTSVAMYEANIEKEGWTSDATTIAKIANSYRQVHDTENAERWYSELISLSDDPIHLLHFAQALQSNGKSELAKEYFLQYHRLTGGTDKRGEILAAAIDRMNELKRSDVVIENVRIINSASLDFSPAFYKGGIIFVSSRNPDFEPDRNKDIWIDDNFMTLFYSREDMDGNLGPPEDFSEEINTKYHEGPLTFSANGEKVYFTRNNYNRGKKTKGKDDIVRLNIYTSNKEGKDWSTPIKLPFCTNDFDETNPTLSSDNNRLYFSSNRDGGFGGMDLYVSEYKQGTWSEPVNLGGTVNTSGNEVFPFIHDDGTLYFSSNGWGGVGGLDIFSTVESADSEWSEPVNIGLPFNSPKDDFGFILNVLGTEGYLSSARKGGIGQDDIYSFALPPDKMKKPRVKTGMTAICTYDITTGERIAGADVMVIEKSENRSVFKLTNGHTFYIPPTRNEAQLMTILRNKAFTPDHEGLVLQTNEEGDLLFDLQPESEYIFIAREEGYDVADKVISTKSAGALPAGQDYCIPMVKPSDCLTLKGIVTNLADGNRISNATVTLINHCTNEMQAVESDLVGAFSFPCLDCNCTYSLKAQKVYFSQVSEHITLEPEQCSKGNTLNYNLQLSSIHDQSGSSTASRSGPIHIDVGTVIELENIYYDFDKHNIRPGAARTLDKVVRLLRRYPSMHLELSAHTDCRGTDRYNDRLSQRRAEYAINYLVRKGIDARRLSSAGWGENRLRNRCADNVSCNEEEHQYNRRTEIRVTAFDRNDIRLRYIDNPPEVIDPYIPGRRR